MITVYYLTSQPMEIQRISMFVSICVLTSLVSQSLGLLIGAGLSVESGVFLGPVSSIPTVLFSGFFVTFDTIPDYLKWLTWASYSRYGFEGILSFTGFAGAIYGNCIPYFQLISSHSLLYSQQVQWLPSTETADD